jgi:His-Xaa-Ser system protein HxsD
MINFDQLSPSVITFSVDLDIFNDRIVTKVMYWLSDSFFIFMEKKQKVLQIQLEKKVGVIDEKEFCKLKIKINQDFIDFKTRDIVNQETKSIRELLLVKAFSVTDDFDERNLFQEED